MTEHLAVDVAIIGGGTAACAAAVALREAGLTVAVLEKRLCGAGASGVNFGGVRQQGRHLAELPLARRARALWDNLNQLLGEDVEFEASGHIKLARSETDMAELERYAESAREHGLALTLLGANAVRDELPCIGPKVHGASLSPTDGHANPRVVGPAYARLARRRGVAVRECAPVRHAVSTGVGFEIEADGLTVKSCWLVNAAGVGAGVVASWFGEPAPVSPLMPNMLVTEPLPYVISRSIGVCGGDVYVRQIRRGNVILGGGHGWGDAELGLARPQVEESLGSMRRAVDIVPALAGVQVIRTWSGMDGQMPDHIPVIGFSSTTPRLVHAFGFSGHGFQLGPVIGLIIAELIDEGHTISPIAPFAPQRFANWTDEPVAAYGGVQH
ncbi:FAD-binding oxidoreductase [Bradyrhizobium prioriisuperbiae]|uniref:NAD(P)/FAD-dependent oxidoreductase n=1 Tax=Bradyrhizobium prioriisuperbiae TaxID=2854389 RepID=UPI0028E79B46|nr:FAD-binding oxidoreductase [Bradyrhizobium prioritasuperba]